MIQKGIRQIHGQEVHKWILLYTPWLLFLNYVPKTNFFFFFFFFLRTSQLIHSGKSKGHALNRLLHLLLLYSV